MSRYASDPRVTARDNSYTVQVGNETVHVLNNGVMGWGAYTGPNLDLIITAGGPWIGIADADDLIGVLLQAANDA